SCSVSTVGEFCCASGVPASAEHAILVNRSGSTVEAFGDAQHERPLLHSPLAVLPSVNAASCGAVQRRYYLDFDDSRNDPPPSEWLGRPRSQRGSIRTQLTPPNRTMVVAATHGGSGARVWPGISGLRPIRLVPQPCVVEPLVIRTRTTEQDHPGGRRV